MEQFKSGKLQRALVQEAVRPAAGTAGAEGGELLGRSSGKALILRRRDFLYRMGERLDAIYMVRSGVLKSCLIGIDGSERILGFHGPGDVLGLEALSGSVVRCDLIVLDTTSVIRIPLNVVRGRCRDSETAEECLLGQMNRQQIRLEALLQQERLNAPARVAFFLLTQARLHRDAGCSDRVFHLPMTRRELARYLNLANETVSRVFTRLRRQGVIHLEGRMVTLVKPEYLGEMTGPVADGLVPGSSSQTLH